MVMSTINYIAEHHLQTKNEINWDSTTCITYSTDYYQRLTLESWFTYLEQRHWILVNGYRHRTNNLLTDSSKTENDDKVRIEKHQWHLKPFSKIQLVVYYINAAFWLVELLLSYMLQPTCSEKRRLWKPKQWRRFAGLSCFAPIFLTN